MYFWFMYSINIHMYNFYVHYFINIKKFRELDAIVLDIWHLQVHTRID